MRVATWNTQGSFMEGKKQAIVREINDRTDVPGGGRTLPDMPTPNRGHALDFFVIMTKGNVPSGRVWAVPVEPSDHDPAFMDVN